MTDENDGRNSMTLGEVIDEVMRSTHCSRRQARRKIAKWIKDKKLTHRLKPTTASVRSSGHILPPHEAADRFENDPRSIGVSLGELMINHDLTWLELAPELISGRLKIHVINEDMLLEHELAMMEKRPVRNFNPHHYHVRGDHLIKWLSNPRTPQHLVSKVTARRSKN